MTNIEPVAWRTFDGEGGYTFREYEGNEDYREWWEKHNPNHKGWVEPLYSAKYKDIEAIRKGELWTGY